MTPAAAWLFLTVAIAAEVVATSALAKSESFTRVGPSLVVMLGYGLAFYLLSFPLRVMPVGVVYAIWSGMGVVLVTAIGWALFGQKLDLAAMVGLAFILAGVLIVNLFSKTVIH